MEPVRKSFKYLSLLPQHPQEFYERATQAIEFRILDRLFRKPVAYQPVSWGKAIQDMETHFGHVVADILGESALSDIEEKMRPRLENLRHAAPFSLSYSADPNLGRCCYLACRLLKPGVVLETGVAYGVTSAYILRALEENGYGRLCSVDMPPPGRTVDSVVGIAIPEDLKNRWYLYYGFSRRVMPRLLREMGEVDIFIQDSAHTYRNMRWEFEALWPNLRPGGIVIADDIQGNSAFAELQKRDPSFLRSIEEVEKEALFGVVIK